MPFNRRAVPPYWFLPNGEANARVGARSVTRIVRRTGSPLRRTIPQSRAEVGVSTPATRLVCGLCFLIGSLFLSLRSFLARVLIIRAVLNRVVRF